MVQGLNRAAAFAAAAAARLRPTKSAFREASHSDHYRSQDGCEQRPSLTQHLGWDAGVGGYGILSLGKKTGVRDVFLWAAKRLKKILHHRNPPLHSENGLIGAFKGRTRDLNLFVAYQDPRSAGRVHHMDYPATHVRLGGQPVGRKVTETPTVPILVRVLPT